MGAIRFVFSPSTKSFELISHTVLEALVTNLHIRSLLETSTSRILMYWRSSLLVIWIFNGIVCRFDCFFAQKMREVRLPCFSYYSATPWFDFLENSLES